MWKIQFLKTLGFKNFVLSFTQNYEPITTYTYSICIHTYKCLELQWTIAECHPYNNRDLLPERKRSFMFEKNFYQLKNTCGSYFNRITDIPIYKTEVSIHGLFAQIITFIFATSRQIRRLDST